MNTNLFRKKKYFEKCFNLENFCIITIIKQSQCFSNEVYMVFLKFMVAKLQTTKNDGVILKTDCQFK